MIYIFILLVYSYYTKNTKDRLLQLENHQQELESAIELEKLTTINISKEQIIFFLEQFKSGSLNDDNYKIKLIETFVYSIYLYDDNKLIINYKGSHSLRQPKSPIQEPLLIINTR